MKRVRIAYDRPNRLFETWLEEWRNEAMLRDSELQHHFAKALDSLRKYPLPLASGRECIILRHFGTKLCAMLEKKLLEHRKEQSARAVDTRLSEIGDNENRVIASRKESIRENKFVEKPMVAAKQRVQSTKRNVPRRLADEVAPIDADEKIYLEPKTFDIILLVDIQETCGGKTKPRHDATLVELTRFDILFEVRHLKVGDFAWIARCRRTNDELTIPYIAERKRMDDLSASIIDGRFHEQKFRLKRSGIENLIYIVESIDKNARFSIPLLSLFQASVNCLVQDGFTVKYTKSHKDSMFYLSCMTKNLIKIYKDKKLVGCKKEYLQMDNSESVVRLMEFKEFNKTSSKQRTFKVSEMFIRQLLQLKGMSIDKAVAIVERYATPQILVTALHNAGANGEQLLASIQVGAKKRQLGPAISRTIHQLYTMNDLN